jgi:hypothetical protein
MITRNKVPIRIGQLNVIISGRFLHVEDPKNMRKRVAIRGTDAYNRVKLLIEKDNQEGLREWING